MQKYPILDPSHCTKYASGEAMIGGKELNSFLVEVLITQQPISWFELFFVIGTSIIKELNLNFHQEYFFSEYECLKKCFKNCQLVTKTFYIMLSAVPKLPGKSYSPWTLFLRNVESTAFMRKKNITYLFYK